MTIVNPSGATGICLDPMGELLPKFTNGLDHIIILIQRLTFVWITTIDNLNGGIGTSLAMMDEFSQVFSSGQGPITTLTLIPISE